ncbi:MAG: hypothetical protein JSV91_12025 [Phycisphaerales bacterium]|nr:MAG: hypothetical protein JSV91_12025 [Phycisphaerales bacterium]
MAEMHTSSDHAGLLRRFLADRDMPCPVCRYNLRGLDSERCPECGAHLDIRVGSTDLRLGAWLTLLFSVGLPLGFFGIMTLAGLIIDLSRGYFSPLGLWIPIIVGCACFGPATVLVVRCRHALWATSPRRRWMAAMWGSLIAWLLAGVLISIATGAA